MAGDEYLIKIQLQVQNDRALQLLTKDMERVAKQQPKIERGFKKTQIAARASGRGLQNVSYQLQDIIVQTSGGVDVMRSLSQQLPQMMINMGAFGAAVGVAAAAVPLLIQGMKAGEEVTLEWSDALGVLQDSIGDLNSIDVDIDFDSWNKAWNEASKSVRETRLEILKFNNVKAENALADAAAAMDLQVAEDTGGSWWERFVAGYKKAQGSGGAGDAFAQSTEDINKSLAAQGVENFAEKLGITPEAAATTKAMFDAVESGAKSIDDLDAHMRNLGINNKDLPAGFYELATAVEERARATNKLNDALEQQIAAEAALASGKDLPVDGSGGGSALEGFENVDAFIQKMGDLQGVITDAKIAGNDYNQMQREFIIASEGVTVAATEEAEAFSLLDFGIETFGKSFDTMLNGVLMGTQSISDGFRDMSKVVIAQVLKVMAQMAIAKALTGAGYGELAARISPEAKGDAFNNGSVVPFAKGGVFNSPQLFPMAKGGIGMLGEAGPEAIMPLSRGKDGKLGVAAGGGMNVTINNNAPGVDVRARQGEDGLTIDVVMKQIASAIGQGGNDLANAFEGTYSLGRGRAVY